MRKTKKERAQEEVWSGRYYETPFDNKLYQITSGDELFEDGQVLKCVHLFTAEFDLLENVLILEVNTYSKDLSRVNITEAHILPKKTNLTAFKQIAKRYYKFKPIKLNGKRKTKKL